MNEYSLSVGVGQLMGMVQRVQPVSRTANSRRAKVLEDRKKASTAYRTGTSKKNNLLLSAGYSNTQFDARI